jgi:hypothetical protein
MVMAGFAFLVTGRLLLVGYLMGMLWINTSVPRLKASDTGDI